MPHFCCHRMSKTFDNISEAASTNYLFLKAQMTLSLALEPPTPPPLYALSLPSELVRAARWVVKCFQEAQKARAKRLERRKSEAAQDASIRKSEDESAEAGSAGPSLLGPETSVEPTLGPKAAATAEAPLSILSRGEESVRKRNLALSVEATRKSLAEAVTQYVLDHQADVAQEERWRTSMQRKMEKHFQDMKANQAQMKANQDQMMKANQGQMNQNFENLRAELESTRKQMNADTMEQIKSALRDHFSAV